MNKKIEIQELAKKTYYYDHKNTDCVGWLFANRKLKEEYLLEAERSLSWEPTILY